ncbi:hypothetical protein ACVBEG_27095 [Pseudomonas sp. GG8]
MKILQYDHPPTPAFMRSAIRAGHAIVQPGRVDVSRAAALVGHFQVLQQKCAWPRGIVAFFGTTVG